MTPHKQLLLHRPDQGQIGDCWRTCFACLLDLHPSEVPHFVEDCWEDWFEANRRARSWLACRELGYMEVAYGTTLEATLAAMKALNPGMYYLLAGTSRNGTGHSVIACDDVIVWDPAIDDAGIVGPMDDGWYWVSFLVPALISANRASTPSAERMCARG